MAEEDVLTRLFTDPVRAAGTLHALEELYLFAGTVRPLEDFQQALQTRLAVGYQYKLRDRIMDSLGRANVQKRVGASLFDAQLCA